MKYVPKAQGFHTVAAAMVLLVVGAAGLAGWKVAQNQRAETAASSNETAQEKPRPAAPTLPDGWRLYADEKVGIQFGYPASFGSFTVSPKDDLQYSPQLESGMRSDIAAAPYIPGLSGRFSVETHKKGNFESASTKYGPTIKLTGDTWIVSKLNGSNPTTYKVGDEYTDIQRRNSAGTNVYAIESGDEGVYRYSIYFVTNGRLHELHLPSFDTGAYSGDTFNDKSMYDDFYQQLLETVTPY